MFFLWLYWWEGNFYFVILILKLIKCIFKLLFILDCNRVSIGIKNFICIKIYIFNVLYINKNLWYNVLNKLSLKWLEILIMLLKL